MYLTIMTSCAETAKPRRTIHSPPREEGWTRRELERCEATFIGAAGVVTNVKMRRA
jgi:hypothetical protein